MIQLTEPFSLPQFLSQTLPGCLQRAILFVGSRTPRHRHQQPGTRNMPPPAKEPRISAKPAPPRNGKPLRNASHASKKRNPKPIFSEYELRFHNSVSAKRPHHPNNEPEQPEPLPGLNLNYGTQRARYTVRTPRPAGSRRLVDMSLELHRQIRRHLWIRHLGTEALPRGVASGKRGNATVEEPSPDDVPPSSNPEVPRSSSKAKLTC